MVNANARSTRWPRVLDILAVALVFNLCAAQPVEATPEPEPPAWAQVEQPFRVGQGAIEPTLAKERVKEARVTTYSHDERFAIEQMQEALRHNQHNTETKRPTAADGGQRIERDAPEIERMTQEWNRHYSLMSPLRSDGRSGGHYRREQN